MDCACKALKTDGTRCQARPLLDSELCFWHDPATENERTEAQRLGGVRRKRESTIVAAYDLGELGGLEDYEQVLRMAILDTMSLENSVSRNRTLGSLVAIGMSLVEKNELASKLRALESVLEPRHAQPEKEAKLVATVSVLASRLGRLSQGLTAKERAFIAVRASLANEPHDPDLLRDLPPGQLTEYNHWVGLHYVANVALWTLAESIRMQLLTVSEIATVAIELSAGSLLAAEQLGEEVDVKKLRVKNAGLNLPEFLEHHASLVRAYARNVMLARWVEIRAIEIVWAELRAEFDGLDIVQGDSRNSLEEAKTCLFKTWSDAGLKQRKMPEPDEEMVEGYREVVERTMRSFNLLESA